nr:protein phosphatase inhibitor 2 [Onthophagus taurus]
MADNLNKRPRKGILKNSSSFDTQESHCAAKKNKETTWDEMNIIATLHPPDKDYGHMKIEEPKTPFNYVDPDSVDALDAADLAEKIKLGAEKLPKSMETNDDDDDDESDEDLTPEELEKRKEFESKRKMHYNEFYAVKLARKLLEEEEEDDEDDKNDLKENVEGEDDKDNEVGKT